MQRGHATLSPPDGTAQRRHRFRGDLRFPITMRLHEGCHMRQQGEIVHGDVRGSNVLFRRLTGRVYLRGRLQLRLQLLLGRSLLEYVVVVIADEHRKRL